LEEFVVQIYTGGKITIPNQLRKRFDVKEGDYVRLVLMEIFKENNDGEWISRKVE
jgi:AbrB family looped-hinge helix DNA binding protein